MELIDLKANTRTKSGKGPARTLRREQRLPAVLYGPNTAPVPLSIVTRDLEKALKASSSPQPLFNLTIEESDLGPLPVMIKELQAHPVSGNYIHVDFCKIAMDRKIRSNVPVVTKGKCIGVEMGGMLQIIRHELEVLCLPLAVPDAIEIDITDLNIGDSVHVHEIPLEGDIEIPADVNFTVLTILSPKKEEAAEEEVEEGEEGMEEGGAEEVETAEEA